jgi:16S rRNA U516 pseudouridylate synthase RsuA-like enzyme
MNYLPDPPDLTQIHLPSFMSAEWGISRSEARRCIAQGAVKLNGEVEHRLDVPVTELSGRLLSLGRRRSARMPTEWHTVGRGEG